MSGKSESSANGIEGKRECRDEHMAKQGELERLGLMSNLKKRMTRCIT